jgi:hypothetical protein
MAQTLKESIFKNPGVWIPTFAIGGYLLYRFGRPVLENIVPDVVKKTETQEKGNPFNYDTFLSTFSLDKKGGAVYNYATAVEKAEYLRTALTRTLGEDVTYLNRFAATVPSQRDFAMIVKAYTQKYGSDLFVDLKEGAGFRSSLPTGGLSDAELKTFLKALYDRPVIR